MQGVKRTIGNLLLTLVTLAAPSLLLAQASEHKGDTSETIRLPAAGDTLVLTMNEARIAFLQRSPAALAVRYHLSSSEADLVAAGLYPNPQLSVNASSIDIAHKPVDYSLTQTSYRLDQPLDVFGKRGKRVAMAEHSVGSARADFANALFQMTCDLKEAFLSAAFAQRQVGLARDRLALFQRTLETSGLRFKAGDIAEAELTKLRLAELDYRQGESDASQGLEDALSALRQMLFLPPTAVVRAKYSFKPELTHPDGDSMAAMAVERRTDLAAQRERTLMQQSRIVLAHRSSWPDVSLGVELDRQGPAWKNLVGGGGSLSLPLFTRNQDEIQRSEAEYEAAVLDQHAKENAVANGVHAAYEKFHTSYMIFSTLSDTTLRSAAEVRAAAARSYGQGNIGLVDFLETERIYNDAVNSYLNALSKFAVNQVELERAVGTPLFEGERQ